MNRANDYIVCQCMKNVRPKWLGLEISVFLLYDNSITSHYLHTHSSMYFFHTGADSHRWNCLLDKMFWYLFIKLLITWHEIVVWYLVINLLITWDELTPLIAPMLTSCTWLQPWHQKCPETDLNSLTTTIISLGYSLGTTKNTPPCGYWRKECCHGPAFGI